MRFDVYYPANGPKPTPCAAYECSNCKHVALETVAAIRTVPWGWSTFTIRSDDGRYGTSGHLCLNCTATTTPIGLIPLLLKVREGDPIPCTMESFSRGELPPEAGRPTRVEVSATPEGGTK